MHVLKKIKQIKRVATATKPLIVMCYNVWIRIFAENAPKNQKIEKNPPKHKCRSRQIEPKRQNMYSRVQWFWLFFTFWGITTHPWHPKGPRIWKLAKKNFKLHPWPAEIFGKNRKMRFFGLVPKFDFRSPVWQIFTIFSACFIYGSPNTHTKF